MLFTDLNLSLSILKAIDKQNYIKPTPIQEKAIPPLLSGKDLLGCAQTGTGKTAAFAIPILQRLLESNIDQDKQSKIRALVLAPTRELAIQIGESFEAYGEYTPLEIGIIFGGVTPKRHIKVLKREPNILVATPGRLLDFVNQGYVDLSQIEIFVLDEADRMLDLGMITDVKTILSKLPEKRQNMFFSATIPKEVTKLINTILSNPVTIKVEHNKADDAEIIQQVYFVEPPDKISLLAELLQDKSYESVLVFTRTKGKADRVSKALNKRNIVSKAIHGDKNQSERVKALGRFKNKEMRVLVATDIAARGIDIDKLTHVINLDIPNVPETYVHRIGRTGRASTEGTAISFCSQEEKEFLTGIEKLIGKSINIMEI
ncbi:MAG TPA: DEAD/DEAH box helicase [Epulopiscium sp.]|nr:DEAD/DEAH box helicase [Candidatus Epulonipiscium sp.]